MAHTTTQRGMGVPLTAFTAGAVVAVLLGVFGRLHDPTLNGTTTLGFRTVLAMKVVVGVVVGVLALLQLLGAFWLYGRLGLRVPSWLGTVHRSTGALALLLAGCHKSMTKILKNPDPEYKLRIAEQFFVKKKYNKAQVVYEDIMPFFKTRPEFQDVYYKYAYCAYYQSDFLNAENLFKTFLEIFPNSSRSEEVDYMRAYCYYRQSPKPELDQTNTIKAIGMLQTFINTHPGSARNKEAQEIIDVCRGKLETKDFKSAQLYFDMGQFRAAGVAFSALLNAFPESPSTTILLAVGDKTSAATILPPSWEISGEKYLVW